MNDIQASKALGLFSIALGFTELVLGRSMNRGLALKQSPTLVRAFGAREVVVGSMVLMHPDDALPLWLRVGGDVLDLAVLAGALRGRRSRNREATLIALVAVLGVTVADVITATALMQRHKKAQATARRTRVRKA